MCGRIIASPQSTVAAFRGAQRDTDSYYMDRVSVTHGQLHQHDWSFVGGYNPQMSM